MYYIVEQDNLYKLSSYANLEIAKADMSVKLMHYNGYSDYHEAISDLNYFNSTKEVSNGIEISKESNLRS